MTADYPPAGLLDPLARRTKQEVLAELRLWRLAGALIAGCAVLGVFQAVLWSRLAPGVLNKVFKDGTFGALPTESTHEFMSVAIFAGIGLAVGLSMALVCWSVVSTRGPAAVLILGSANALGALTGYLVGPLLAPGIDPGSVGSSNVESLVTAPPVLGNVMTILAQPVIAVAVYTFLALWSGNRDLGRTR